MKNNSLLIKVWALAVSSAAVVSCEVMDDYMHVDSSVIKFGVDADADGAPSTRATQYADSPVVMLGELPDAGVFRNLFVISNNHFQSGFLKMNALLEKGHRKLGWIPNEPRTLAGRRHVF